MNFSQNKSHQGFLIYLKIPKKCARTNSRHASIDSIPKLNSHEAVRQLITKFNQKFVVAQATTFKPSPLAPKSVIKSPPIQAMIAYQESTSFSLITAAIKIRILPTQTQTFTFWTHRSRTSLTTTLIWVINYSGLPLLTESSGLMLTEIMKKKFLRLTTCMSAILAKNSTKI